jgi:hypothetical protein
MTPAVTKSCVDPMNWNPKFASPLGHSETFPVQSYADVLPRVVLLGLVSGPAAVLLGVASRAVNSIEAMPLRAIAHVGVKHLERFPRWIVVNASTAVSRVVLMLRTTASLLHSAPRVICQRLGLSVRGVPLGSDLFPKAAARLGLAAFEFPCLRCCIAAALARAVPLTPADIGNCGQARKALPRDVDEVLGVISGKCDAQLLPVATARLDGPAFYVPEPDNFFDSASTPKEPTRCSVNGWLATDRGQKAVCDSGLVDGFSHASFYRTNLLVPQGNG